MESNDIDLRFVIGLFFIVVSLLLLIASFTVSSGYLINRNVGAAFLIFGAIMVGLSWKKYNDNRKERG